MDIGTNCPACGAQISLDADAKEATCSFCGNRFDVDLKGVQPALQVVKGDYEMPDPPRPAEQPVQPRFDPPVTVDEPAFKPQVSRPITPDVPARTGRPIWMTIAIIFAGLLLLACACMAAAYAVIQNL